MSRNLRYYILLISSASVLTKEPELPLCPANFQFLPQNLPMHCRLPVSSHQQAPFAPPFIPGLAPGKPPENSQPVPVPPIPNFAKLPGFPPGFPGAPGYAPGPPPGFPPMGMPMPGAPPSAKLPVIVMPFYSPDPSFKGSNRNSGETSERRKHRKRRIHSSDHDDDTETDTDTDYSDTDSDSGFWKERRSMRRQGNPRRRRRKNSRRRKELLTPILQYVTKDGYVIYEKKISNGEAKDWLGKGQDIKQEENTTPEPTPRENSEERRVVDEEEDIATTTQKTHEPPKTIQFKIQKNSEKVNHRRHPRHKPNYLIEKPLNNGKE